MLFIMRRCSLADLADRQEAIKSRDRDPSGLTVLLTVGLLGIIKMVRTRTIHATMQVVRVTLRDTTLQ